MWLSAVGMDEVRHLLSAVGMDEVTLVVSCGSW